MCHGYMYQSVSVCLYVCVHARRYMYACILLRMYALIHTYVCTRISQVGMQQLGITIVPRSGRLKTRTFRMVKLLSSPCTPSAQSRSPVEDRYVPERRRLEDLMDEMELQQRLGDSLNESDNEG